MGNSILEALLGASQEGQQLAGAENPYAPYAGIANQISDAVQQQGVAQKYGTRDTLIAAALSGLVGGGLNQLGTNYTNKQAGMYQNALLGSLAGNNAMPEGMNEGLFKKAQSSADLFKLKQKIQETQDIMDYNKQIKLAGGLEQAKEEGKLNAYSSSQLKDNPLNPIVKADKEAKKDLMSQAQQLRNEISNSPEYKAYSLITPSMKALKSLAKDDTRASDLPFVYELVKVLDPGSVVREGEIALASGINSPVAKYMNELTSATTGTSKLSPETKTQLLALVSNKYKALKDQYKTVAEPRLSIGSKYGISPDEILTLPFDDLPVTQVGSMKPNMADYGADEGMKYLSDVKKWSMANGK